MERNLLCLGAAAVASLTAMNATPLPKKVKKNADRPNILLIMVDDMGYSDLGCFGSEIPTPNLDRLASSGIRYTNFYNTARSCPTRASLLTGLYQHDAGIGGMSEDGGEMNKERSSHDQGTYGYRGALNQNCVTLGEVLKSAGYHTYMVGKWHVGLIGKEKWPLQRGFDRYYGILAGACSYLMPQGGRGLTLDNTQLDPPSQPYYTTDAFTDYALEFIKSSEKDKDPFFLYMAFNAPHWPLHAKQEDIDKFIGKYDQGWEKTREARYNKMLELGIIDESWGLAEWENRSWDQLTQEEKERSSRRMAVYAAQVHCVDYNVGRVLDYLEETGQKDNTLVVFFSDNGACAEPYSETGFMNQDINSPDSWVSPSYGKPWAQVSNTPFRKYKVRAYEGGISTCFIMSWPDRFKKYDGEIRRNTAFLPDIMATFVDVSGATYPTTFKGNWIHPMAGSSMIPTVYDADAEIHDYIFNEHENNKYARWKNWKAVWDQDIKEWELYDVVKDRAETNNLAKIYPEILDQLVYKWNEWAGAHHVYPKRP